MSTRSLCFGAAAVGVIASGQGFAQQPLSAIDWLSENLSTPVAMAPGEPPIANTAAPSDISVVALGDAVGNSVGLVPEIVTGLPRTLWKGSDPAVLARLITELPTEQLPALQSLLFKVLLAEADQDADPLKAQDFLLTRIDRLMVLGAIDPAQALIEQAGPTRSKKIFSRWFDLTLLSGEEDRACAVLRFQPHLAPDYSAQIFCAVRAGDWENAALMLDVGRVLGLIDDYENALLERLLDAESYDDTPVQPASDMLTPLNFRLHETIGQALPAASLPRVFANADLRDLAGWKSQLDAAERLTRSGALPANRLLGIYTARLPAASGGIWDRVEALQRFDTALNRKNPNAIGKTLPAAWRAMQTAGLEVSFSQLFARKLFAVPLFGDVQKLAYEVALLSPDYENAAKKYGNRYPTYRFLTGVAKGDVARLDAPDETAAAIADAFKTAPMPKNVAALAAEGRIGEAILRTMILFDRGTKGDLHRLTQSLAALRALGLEDTARRASLQLLLRPEV